MKSRIIWFLVLALVQVARAQEDSLIYAIGKITNHSTKELITARITYQSEPYRNIVGAVNGSEFSIPLYGNMKYSITVEAPGFAVAK